MKIFRQILVVIALVTVIVLSPLLLNISLETWQNIHNAFAAKELNLPAWIDYAAVCVFSILGTMTARVKGYDFVGAFVLAGVTAMGGALLRDGLCLQGEISPLFTDSGYVLSLTAAWFCAIYFGEYLMRFDNFMVLCDAIGLGLYAVFGTNKSLMCGLSVPVAIGIGTLNAVGGGLLRDVISGEQAQIFKPGQFYTGIAVLSAALYVLLIDFLPPTIAAFIVVVLTIVARFAVIRYNIHSETIADKQNSVKRIIEIIHDKTHHKKK
ncbi:MAG: TRIC cation channel family protein [Opitutales bacterium]|nr:TRIC cation channel family protein [Opitutales bacterium]